MNSGAPITGIERRPLNKAGMDISQNSLCSIGETSRIGQRMPDIIPRRQSRFSRTAQARFGYWHSARVT
jgi:hypothetical protein